MDQPAQNRELAGADGARDDAREELHKAKAENRSPANRAVKQRMERELRAQGLSPEAIARILHLGL